MRAIILTTCPTAVRLVARFGKYGRMMLELGPLREVGVPRSVLQAVLWCLDLRSDNALGAISVLMSYMNMSFGWWVAMASWHFVRFGYVLDVCRCVVLAHFGAKAL